MSIVEKIWMTDTIKIYQANVAAEIRGTPDSVDFDVTIFSSGSKRLPKTGTNVNFPQSVPRTTRLFPL